MFFCASNARPERNPDHKTTGHALGKSRKARPAGLKRDAAPKAIMKGNRPKGGPGRARYPEGLTDIESDTALTPLGRNKKPFFTMTEDKKLI